VPSIPISRLPNLQRCQHPNKPPLHRNISNLQPLPSYKLRLLWLKIRRYEKLTLVMQDLIPNKKHKN
jgi:hypothetical protein